jgi:hypothetical protein
MIRLVLLPAFALGACVAIPDGPGSQGGIELGLIAVHHSPPQDKAAAVVVSRVGGWITGEGAGLGYAKSKVVKMGADCRVVFLIENEEQLARSVELVKSTLDAEGGDICVTG